MRKHSPILREFHHASQNGKIFCSFLAIGGIVSLYGMLSAQASSPVVTRKIDVKVNVEGYEPAQIQVAPNEKVILRVTRVTDATCATEIVVPDFHVKKDLPLNQPVLVDLGVPTVGQHVFGCGMSLMVNGMLTVGHPEIKAPYAPPAKPQTKPAAKY